MGMIDSSWPITSDVARAIPAGRQEPAAVILLRPPEFKHDILPVVKFLWPALLQVLYQPTRRCLEGQHSLHLLGLRPYESRRLAPAEPVDPGGPSDHLP